MTQAWLPIALIALCTAACNDKVDVPGPGPLPAAGTGAGTGTGTAGILSFGTAGSGSPTRNGGSAGSGGSGFSSGLAGQGSNIRGGIAGTTANAPTPSPSQPPLPAP
jgi:hypothetical protein